MNLNLSAVVISSNFVTKKLRNEYVYVPIVLAFVALVVMRKVLFDVNFAIFGDNTYLYLPLFAAASKIFASGEYPYWINTVAGGLPIFDTPQFTVDYPFYLLWTGLYKSAYALTALVHYLILFHYYVMLLNFYIMLRVFRLRIAVALFGTMLFTFSANNISYLFNVTLMAPYSWLPLFIASLVMCMEWKSWIIGFSLSILSVVMLVLSAPSLPFIHCCYIAAVISLAYVVTAACNKNYSQLIRFFKIVIPAGLVSFAIVSPYLISELLAMPGFIRWIENGVLIGNARIPFESFLLGQLSPENLLDVFLPLNGRFIIGNPFFGLAGIVLVFLSLNRIKQNPVVCGLLFLTLWGLLSAFGSNFGLAYINYHVPFFNLMREPGRHLYIFIFGASVLAAFGLDYVVSNISHGRKFFITGYNVVSFLLVGFVLGLTVFWFKKSIENHYMVIALTSMALLVVYALTGNKQVRVAVISVFMPLVIISNLLQYSFNPIPLYSGDYFSEWNIRSHTILEELSNIDDISKYRIIFQEPKYDQGWSMNGSYHGIRSFNAYFNPLPYDLFSDMFYQGPRHEGYRELLGTKYILCKDQCEERTFSSFKFERELHGYKLYKSENAFPHYKVIHEIQDIYENKSEFYEKLTTEYDHLNRILVQKKDLDEVRSHLAAGVSDSSESCFIREEVATANKLYLSVACSRSGVLVLNEYFTPSWHAKVNGDNKTTYKLNLNQIGVPVYKGQNYVEFNYRPTVFYRLRVISRIVVVSLVLFLVYATYVTRRKRRNVLH